MTLLVCEGENSLLFAPPCQRTRPSFVDGGASSRQSDSWWKIEKGVFRPETLGLDSRSGI